jgi:hypothetical protein
MLFRNFETVSATSPRFKATLAAKPFIKGHLRLSPHSSCNTGTVMHKVKSVVPSRNPHDRNPHDVALVRLGGRAGRPQSAQTPPDFIGGGKGPREESMMKKPFLLVISDREIRAVNLLQVASMRLADKTLTLRMSSGKDFVFSEKQTKLTLLKAICDCAILSDGSPAGPQMRTVLERVAAE